MMPVADLAYLSGAPEDEIFALGQQVCANPGVRTAAHQRLTDILEDAFTGPRGDARPVFAAFYEDFQGVLEPTAPG